jgi:hypothetical protein
MEFQNLNILLCDLIKETEITGPRLDGLKSWGFQIKYEFKYNNNIYIFLKVL